MYPIVKRLLLFNYVIVQILWFQYHLLKANISRDNLSSQRKSSAQKLPPLSSWKWRHSHTSNLHLALQEVIYPSCEFSVAHDIDFYWVHPASVWDGHVVICSQFGGGAPHLICNSTVWIYRPDWPPLSTRRHTQWPSIMLTSISTFINFSIGKKKKMWFEFNARSANFNPVRR